MLFPRDRITSVAALMGGGGGGAPTGHRYWRIYITDNDTAGHTVAAVVEIQFHSGTTGYGADQTGSGTASVDSNAGLGQVASNAVDDELLDANANIWASTNTAFPHWWKYDFGSGNNVDVVGVSIIARGDGPDGVGGTVNNMAPRDFDVQYSDNDSTWTTRWSETSRSFTRYQFRHFRAGTAASYSGSPHGSHQHWRIRMVEDNGGNISSASEIEMRATPSGSDQCSGGTPISDGDIGSGLVDDNAFDNNNTTFFGSTLTASGAAYIGYSFASPVSVAEVTWRSRGDGAADQTPRSFFIQYADSGSGPWTTAWGVSNSSGWSIGETRTFTDPNYV